MGVGSSSLGAGALTRTELLRSTESSRDFINNLFNVMVTKLTPEDFLKLSKTTSCSTFVFLMADSIGKMFEDLRIRPVRGKDTGVVFFQKIDKLKQPTSETRELCLIIAYFYVRIFQIFGALAMSVVDDPSAGAVIGALQYRPPAQAQPGVGFFSRAPARIPGARGAMIGGADARYFLTVNAKKFEPIRELLADPEMLQIGREAPKSAFQFLEKPELYLLPDRTGQNLYFNLGDTNKYLLAQLELSPALRQLDGTYKIASMTLKNFKIVDSELDATGLGTVNNFIKSELYQHKLVSADRKIWDAENASFIETLIRELEKVAKHVEQYKADPEAAAKRAARRRVVGVPAAVPGVVPGVGVGAVEAGVPKALQNQYIIQTLKAMTGYKTTSFCVARALQLLDAKSLYEPKPMDATSGVCLAKFDSLPTSVPEAGKAITSIPGMRALDQLYYVSPHIIRDETVFNKVEPEYTEFLQKFAGLFGRPAATGKLSSLDTVLAKDPNCPATAVKHYLKIQDPRGIQSVLGIVKQMFGRQLTHTKQVLNFFKTKLFVFKKISDPLGGGQRTWIDIHPRLLQGGIMELEKLSKEARGILVGYYSGCEELYQKGVQTALSTKSIPI